MNNYAPIFSRKVGLCCKRPRSIYLNSTMTPRLLEQNYRFFTTPLSCNSQKRLEHKENQTQYTIQYNTFITSLEGAILE